MFIFLSGVCALIEVTALCYLLTLTPNSLYSPQLTFYLNCQQSLKLAAFGVLIFFLNLAPILTPGITKHGSHSGKVQCLPWGSGGQSAPPATEGLHRWVQVRPTCMQPDPQGFSLPGTPKSLQEVWSCVQGPPLIPEPVHRELSGHICPGYHLSPLALGFSIHHSVSQNSLSSSQDRPRHG